MYLLSKKRVYFWLLIFILAASALFGGILFISHKATSPPAITSSDDTISGKLGVPVKVTIPDNEKTTTIVSNPVKTKFAFNAIAPHWKESKPNTEEGVDREFKIRVSNDNSNWGDWQIVNVDGPLRDMDPHPHELFPEAPLFIMGRYYQISISLTRTSTNIKSIEISELTISYLDSREKSVTKIAKSINNLLFPKTIAVEQGPNIISRSGWGSPDPNNTLFKWTDKEWPVSYAPVRQVFIHHTVNSNYSGDFAEVVRGIWQYQSYTRGWGDIGYNYLVDGNGAIYEGRFGGDNVVAGHVTGFNVGTMGVALIGCFQPNDSTCTSLNGGNAGPSYNMLDSLYNLLGWKTKNYEIDPKANHSFCGTENGNPICRDLFTITAHRDAQLTACPGNTIYDILPTIRDAAESRKLNLFPYAAKQLTYGQITSNSGQTSITVQFKNTGTTAWSRTSPRFFLKTANPDDRTSSIQGSGWITSQHAALLNESSVAPGGTGSFTFNVNTDDKPASTFYEGFRLVAEGVTDLKGYFMIPITTPSYKWTQQSLTYSSGSARMAPGSTQTITLVAKNTGTATWTKNGSYPLRLGTLPDGRSSQFYTSGWLAPSRLASLQEDSVEPQQYGTFIFQVKAPPNEGEFGERIGLVAENRAWADDNGAQVYFHIVNPYRWQLFSLNHSTGTALMDPGNVQTITVVAKNTGSATWSNTGDSPIKIGTWPPGRSTSVAHSSWPSPIRAAILREASVPPDSYGTFEFIIRAPYGGEFFERMNLVAEGQSWFNDPGFYYYLNVRNYYAWEFVSLNHSTGTAINTAGSTITLTLEAKNIGNTTWNNTGDFPVRLGTTWPQDRGSILYHNSWLRDFRPVAMQQATVPPGSVGTFIFQAKIPSTPGEYREHFSLVAENITWMNDPGVYFYIKSVP